MRTLWFLIITLCIHRPMFSNPLLRALAATGHFVRTASFKCYVKGCNPVEAEKCCVNRLNAAMQYIKRNTGDKKSACHCLSMAEAHGCDNCCPPRQEHYEQLKEKRDEILDSGQCRRRLFKRYNDDTIV